MLYSNQQEKVITDRESRSFRIRRRTKQGDPTSPNLFNAVLQNVIKDVQDKWRARGWGIDVEAGSQCALCNLRFSDDILLLATSAEQLRHTLNNLMLATRAVGLELHSGKQSSYSQIAYQDLGWGRSRYLGDLAVGTLIKQ